MNITFAEWADHVADLAEELRKASRFTRITHDDDSISIHTAGACLGTLALRLCPGHAIPMTVVSSSTALSGDPTEARSQVARMTEMLDLLDFAYADTYRISVWEKGSCPCDRCATKGTSTGVVCEACSGEGVR